MSGSSRLAEAYIRALGLGRIGIAAKSESGPVAIGIASASEPNLSLSSSLWCADVRSAEEVVRTAHADMATSFPTEIDGMFLATVEQATTAVKRAGEALSIRVAANESIQARVEDRIHRLNVEFKAMQARGDLKDLNGRYREYRSGMSSAGKRGIAYGKFIVNHKVRMAEEAAASEKRNFMLTVSR